MNDDKLRVFTLHGGSGQDTEGGQSNIVVRISYLE